MRLFSRALPGVLILLLAGIAGGVELTEVESLWVSGERDSAFALVMAEIELARAASDSSRLLPFTLYEGAYRAAIGDHRRGETVLRETVTLAEVRQDSLVLASALRWLGVTVDSQGRGAEAKEIYLHLLDLSETAGDMRHAGWARVGLGWDAWKRGKIENSRDQYHRAAECFTNTEDVEGEIWARNGLALVQSNLGEYEAALASHHTILVRSRQEGLPVSEANALNGIGSLEYRLGRSDRALDHFRESLEIHQRLGNRSQRISPLFNIALCQNRLGRSARARETLEGVLATCREEGYGGYEVTTRLKLAETLIILRRLRAAEDYCRQNLAAERELRLEDLINTHIILSDILMEQDRDLETLAALETAADLLRRTTLVWQQLRVAGKLGLITTKLGRHAEARNMFLDLAEGAEQQGVGEFASTALGHAARCSDLLAEPDSAIALYRRAAAGWEADRLLLLDPDWRERRGDAGQQIFTNFAALLHERGETARAFDRLQSYKARTLLERMLGPGKRHEHILTADIPTVDLSEFQREILGEDDLFLDLYLGPEHSLCFAVSRREIRCHELPPEPDLGGRLRSYHDLLARPDAADPEVIAQAGEGLVSSIFGDIEQLLGDHRNIIVAPDGALNLLPFADLPGCGDRTWQRVPGAGVMTRIRKLALENREDGLWHTIALASGRDAAGDDLPGTLREVKGLASKYRGVTWNPVLPESIADISTILTDHEILHFAAHARNEDQSPWQSAIYLGFEERPLRAAEIAGLDLDARLAILSSCSSGAGGIVSGEGVLGLSSAFLSAGVPTVLATLWAVDDAATANFIEYFYSFLAQGFDCGRALRAAQGELRGHPETRHPYYWAGFVILGEGGLQPRLERRGGNPLFLLSGLLVLLFLGLRYGSRVNG